MDSSFPTTVKSITFGDEVEYIPAYLCYNMTGLTSVTIPNSVTSIGSYAFYGCSGLKDFINLSFTPQSSAGSLPTTATIHVLKGCKSAYSASSAWKKYNIVEDTEKFLPLPICAAPVITFVDGEIKCVSETESATCHHEYKITNTSGLGGNSSKLTSKLIVTAYATAEGYIKSKNTVKTFDYVPADSGLTGDVNGDGEVTMSDANEVVNIYLGK